MCVPRPSRILAVYFLFAACSSRDEAPLAEVEEAPTLEEELAGASRVPAWGLVFGSDYPAREAPTREETRAVLFDGDEAGPLLEALLAAGMSEESAIETVYASAGHNSGQAHDPVRQRADEWRAAYQDAVDAFDAEVAAAAAARGEEIDQRTLLEQGLVLGWGNR